VKRYKKIITEPKHITAEINRDILNPRASDTIPKINVPRTVTALISIL
jgi:hypothetical protein